MGKSSPICLYPACINTSRSRGLCHHHYQNMRAYVRAGKVTEADLEARGMISPKGRGNGCVDHSKLLLDPNARGDGPIYGTFQFRTVKAVK